MIRWKIRKIMGMYVHDRTEREYFDLMLVIERLRDGYNLLKVSNSKDIVLTVRENFLYKLENYDD